VQDPLAGRTCTAYPAVMPDVTNAGSKWVEANETFSKAVVDGNLVTAPAWPAHPAWMLKFLELLGSKMQA
jgi:protease I